ncbi:hypothetical protein HK104_002547 [Borealophlyctis nickersoniae]|nr:hypothetical protein HK104_002547 [Borealophlyctis nickersoniae]
MKNMKKLNDDEDEEAHLARFTHLAQTPEKENATAQTAQAKRNSVPTNRRPHPQVANEAACVRVRRVGQRKERKDTKEDSEIVGESNGKREALVDVKVMRERITPTVEASPKDAVETSRAGAAPREAVPKTKPVRERQPVPERRQPVRERRQLVRERRQLVRERRQPVRERRQPVRERRQLVPERKHRKNTEKPTIVGIDSARAKKLAKDETQ